jgi:hypothetical protein
MTLQEFLDATAGVPKPVLRAAMTMALSVEPARTPDAYRRFYRRVLDVLGMTDELIPVAAADVRSGVAAR